MVEASQNLYDGATSPTTLVVGDSNLWQTTQFVDSTGMHDRVSQMFYDWRNRLCWQKVGVEATEIVGVNRPIFFTTYDNLDEPLLEQRFTGDGVTESTGSDGVPMEPDPTKLRAQTESVYDDQGRVYLSKVDNVDQTFGTVAAPLITNLWFDHRGNTIKQSAPGGLITKMQYDGAGREVVVYTTDGGGDSTWADAGNVTGDVVLSQTENQYDAAGRVTMTIDRERFHNETATGALGNSTTAPLARVSYVGNYYDAANRSTSSIDVGTNQGMAFSLPSPEPAGSDTVLRTDYTYTPAGWVGTVTAPRGIVTANSYDALGRTTQVIEAFTGGTPSPQSDRTTQFTYDGDDNLLKRTVLLSATQHETTQYTYAATTAAGNDINSARGMPEQTQPLVRALSTQSGRQSRPLGSHRKEDKKLTTLEKKEPRALHDPDGRRAAQ
jgi:YD repeat-containing protein